MASACVNRPGSPPEPFIDLSPACPSYGCLSPRISFSRDDGPPATSDPDTKPLTDFEFRPEDPVTMLPADELFAGGKLLPLHPAAAPPAAGEICLEEKEGEEIQRPDVSAPSPRAPRCSSRWRELLGLKKQQQQQQSGHKQESKKSAAAVAAAHSKNRSLKQFLHRSVRSAADPSLNLPLLRDSDSEFVSLSSRRSLSSSSSSSSGPDHEDLPRHSLDSEKPSPPPPVSLTRNPQPSRARAASRPRSAAQRTSRSPVRRPAEPAAAAPPRGASIDSPRMNASGRVVFERSSSSPGSFTGGPRVRQRGMERSYSAGIRVAPVLNVPVFGLGQLFKKDREAVAAGSSAATAGGSTRIKAERPS